MRTDFFSCPIKRFPYNSALITFNVIITSIIRINSRIDDCFSLALMENWPPTCDIGAQDRDFLSVSLQPNPSAKRLFVTFPRILRSLLLSPSLFLSFSDTLSFRLSPYLRLSVPRSLSLPSTPDRCSHSALTRIGAARRPFASFLCLLQQHHKVTHQRRVSTHWNQSTSTEIANKPKTVHNDLAESSRARTSHEMSGAEAASGCVARQMRRAQRGRAARARRAWSRAGGGGRGGGTTANGRQTIAPLWANGNERT